MYESHYVGLFFRLWGATESANGISPEHSLLGNSQNPFDELLGDVAGQAGRRFFLIEFKRERAGIAKEVGPKGKAHRRALYEHLREDLRCLHLATHGHLAGYYDDADGKLAFEPYAHAAAPRIKRPKGSPPGYDLNHWIGRLDFNDLHARLTNPNSVENAEVPGAFKEGLAGC